MDWLRHDLRQAVRLLSRRPGFSLLAVLTLALGLSVNTVAFSAVNGLLFKPFRFAGAETTGWLFVASARDPLAGSSLAVFEALERHATTTAVAAEGRAPLAWDTGSGTAQVWALFVSPAYFQLVETTPVVGRTIGDADGRAGDVPVLVSERFWRRRLDAASDLTTKTLDLGGRRAHVIGVLPDDFQGPGGVFEPDVWVPLSARTTLSLPSRYAEPDARWLTLLARPQEGVPASAVEQEALAIATAAGFAPESAEGEPRARYVRFADRHPETRALSSAAAVGMAAVGVVLLIACFNVAGLVLARSVERRRDLGLRAALGASRWRIAREELTGSLVLAAAGCATALLLTLASERLLSVFSLPAPIPQRLHFVTDWRVISFAVLLGLVATVIPSLAPLARITRTDLAGSLGAAGTAQASGPGDRRTRRWFVMLQVAGSTCFLALALIFGAHFIGELRTDTGFDRDHLAVLEVNPAQYGYTPDRARLFADRVRQTAGASPGVAAVSVANRVSFFVGATSTTRVSVGGRACSGTECPLADVYAADGALFETMGIPLIAGRTYDDDDPADRDSVVVSAAAADAFWPDEHPLGQTFRIEPDQRTLTVVGVVADIVHRTMNEPHRPVYYRPLTEADFSWDFTVVARSTGDTDAAIAALGQAAREADRTVPLRSLQSMRDRMALPLWMPRTAAGFFAICGAAAALLSMVGLFGVTYFAVSRRRREFGVRSALGATAADVGRLVIGDTLRLAAPGILVGGMLAVLSGLAAQASFQGLSAATPVPYVGAMLLQSVIALAAGYAPARHAATSNPLDVLRAE
jgi:predicted permease